MEIVKFKKDRSNKYKIYLDNDDILLLYDDVIVKYNLLINKKMDDKELNKILEYNTFMDSYYKVIKFINKKMRTEKEVKNFLKKLEINDIDIEKIINILYKEGYLNKINYLCAYINDQYNLTLNGPLKILKNLIEMDYDENEINKYLYNYEWNSRIDTIIKKKLKLNHRLSNNALKQKLTNDIILLGYEKEDIIEKLNKIDFNTDYDILKNELIKMKKNYSKKYNDKELEYKVINSLLKKGFHIDDIKRCYNEIKI